MTSFTEKTKQFIASLDNAFHTDFHEFWANWDDEREAVLDDVLFWVCYENEDFKKRYEDLQKQVNEDLDGEAEAELQELRWEADVASGWSMKEDWMSDFQKQVLDAYSGPRQREVWRLYDEVVDEFLKSKNLYEWQHDWAVEGIPEPTYKTGTREDGSTFSYSTWGEKERKVEEDRLQLISLLTYWLFMFDDDAYGYVEGNFVSPAVTDKRLQELQAFVAAN